MSKKPENDEILMAFFDCLAEETDVEKINFRFVLTLILMRKRRLKYDACRIEDGKEIWTLKVTGQDRTVDVVNPHLTEDQIESISDQMWQILQDEERKQRLEAEQKARQWQVRRESERTEIIERDGAQEIATQYYEGVITGKIFDLEILVEEFKNDFIQLQKDTGLTATQISEGTKAASPAVGIGAGWATGNIWIGLIAGVVGYLASGPLAQGYARLKIEEWKHKWNQIFSNCSARQFMEMTDALKNRYPMVFSCVFGPTNNIRQLE